MSEATPAMARLEIHKGPDSELCAGGVRFVACRREVGTIDGGITLYLWSEARPEVELIRMDLFRNRPHYHAPAENQQETEIEPGGEDVVAWGVQTVTRRTAQLAREAGYPDLAADLDAGALAQAEGALASMLEKLGEPNEVSYFEVPQAVLDGLAPN